MKRDQSSHPISDNASINETCSSSRTAADALEYPAGWLRDLGLSLDIRCPCTWSRIPSFRMMLDQNPRLASVPLGRILVRLRCKAGCGAAPVRVALLDAQEQAAAAGAKRSTRAWELVLLGEDTPAAS